MVTWGIGVAAPRTCVIHPGVARAVVEPGERRSGGVFWPNNENMLSELLGARLISAPGRYRL